MLIGDLMRAGPVPLMNPDGCREASIDGANLLSDVYDFLGRFVAYHTQHAQVAHTLWIAHAHAMNATKD